MAQLKYLVENYSLNMQETQALLPVDCYSYQQDAGGEDEE
jgi:hypothetical protein